MDSNSFVDAIGNTPLVRINLGVPARIYAKLEYLNPGGSIKDRSASYLISCAEKSGKLKPGGTLIDASSGNQGIATAMIGARRGYNVIICVSEKISKEKYDTLKAYGAQVIKCPVTAFLDDPKSYHSTALKLQQKTPNSFMPNQYFNIQNREAHYRGIGPEIWKQTKGAITHFFAGAGTGGTVTGAGMFLKEQNPNVQVYAVDSVNSWYSTGGNPQPYILEGLGIDFETPVFDRSVINEVFTVDDNQAITTLQYLAQKHGMLVGPSSGAVAAAVIEYAHQLPDDAIAVMIFGDSGRAYLTKEFYTPKQ